MRSSWLRPHSVVYHVVYAALLAFTGAMFFETVGLYNTPGLQPTWSKARAVSTGLLSSSVCST